MYGNMYSRQAVSNCQKYTDTLHNLSVEIYYNHSQVLVKTTYMTSPYYIIIQTFTKFNAYVDMLARVDRKTLSGLTLRLRIFQQQNLLHYMSVLY